MGPLCCMTPMGTDQNMEVDFVNPYPTQDGQEAIIPTSKAGEAGEGVLTQGGSTPLPPVPPPAAAQRISTVTPRITDRVPTWLQAQPPAEGPLG